MVSEAVAFFALQAGRINTFDQWPRIWGPFFMPADR